jgi:hypothetical protein
MATEIIIKENKWYSQIRNGVNFDLNTTDFTNNMVGCVGEKIKNVMRVVIGWKANSSLPNPFTWTSALKRMTRITGSWIADGFSIGDNIAVGYQNESGTWFTWYSANITALSDLEMFLDADLGLPAGDGAFTRMVIHGNTTLTACVLKFGLNANAETYNNISKVTDSEQIYYASGIGAWTDMIPLGTNRDWLAGSCRISFVGIPYEFSREYEIANIFVINPFYKEGWKEYLTTNKLPDLFNGDGSIKYTFQAEFRNVLSNPNTSKIVTNDSVLGSVAWFNENFNGFNNSYAIESVNFTSASDSVNPAIQNNVRIVVSGQDFDNGEKFMVKFINLTKEEDYTNTTTDMLENFMYDSALCTLATTVTGSGIIKNVVSQIIATDLVLDVRLEYTVAQRQRIQAGDSYAIIIVVDDETLTAGNSNRVSLIADCQEYDTSADISDLIGIDTFGIVQHDKDYTTEDGTTDVVSWIEDTLYFKYGFWLDLSKDAYLNEMAVQLIAYNTVNENKFVLNEFILPLTNVIVVNGIQQIVISTNRLYPNFNVVSVETGSLIGNKQYYNAICSMKISWQEWIEQLDADTIFYDNSKLLNNLNKKASNYSELNDYEIKLGVSANVYGTDTTLNTSGNTDYLFLTPSLVINNYEIPVNWTAEIKTFHPDTLVDLNGGIRKDGDTLFQVTWTDVSGAFTDITNFWGLHRIEENRQNGENIHELSSVYVIDSNLLKPLDGQTKLKKSIVLGKVVTDCLIDYTKLQDGLSYSLSARLDDGSDSPLDPCTFITEGNEIFITENDIFMQVENCV